MAYCRLTNEANTDYNDSIRKIHFNWSEFRKGTFGWRFSKLSDKYFSTIGFIKCEVWKHQHKANWVLNNHKNLKLEKGKINRFWSENALRCYIVAIYPFTFHSSYWSITLYWKITSELAGKTASLSCRLIKRCFKPVLSHTVATQHT